MCRGGNQREKKRGIEERRRGEKRANRLHHSNRFLSAFGNTLNYLFPHL